LRRYNEDIDEMAIPTDAADGAAIRTLQQRADSAFRQGRLAEALAACRSILARHPTRADVHAFAGLIALRQGDPATAAESYRTAVDLRPDYVEAHFNLANALKQLHRLTEAEDAYRRVISLRPKIAPAWHNLGNVLLALDRTAEAADAYRQVLEIDPSNPDTHRNLGIALQKEGALDEAIVAYRQALARRPGWPPVASNLVQAHLEADDAEAAIAVCDEWLAYNPGHIEALALKCAALNEAGNQDALAGLLDFDRFVVERRIEPPAGYGSIDEFNAALAAHILAHPTLKVPPASDPTYHHPKLQITEEILGETGGPMAAMAKIMRESVEDYWAHMGDDPTHPFLANRPRTWALSAWAVVLQGEGNLVPHIHLDGYLGGSYYVQVPREVLDPDRQEGWFELGRPPSELVLHRAPMVRPLQPLAGKMLQFPGYFYHGTTPYRSETGEIRITIAFDVVRKT
jgi:Tfp pilus assembly protein PilF